MPDDESLKPPRPAGRTADTQAGTDDVVGPEPKVRRSLARGGGPDDAPDEAPAPEGATPEALDERDRRQSSQRKAGGPEGGRVRDDDVVIERADGAEGPPPTDPA